MIFLKKLLLFLVLFPCINARVIISNEKCSVVAANDKAKFYTDSLVAQEYLLPYIVFPGDTSANIQKRSFKAKDAIYCLPDDNFESSKNFLFVPTRSGSLDVCNSNAIVALKELATHNSNTGLFYLQVGSDLARGNSNYGVMLLDRFQGGSQLARGNSNYGMSLILGPNAGSMLAKGNSNAGVFYLNQGSEQAIDDSNAVLDTNVKVKDRIAFIEVDLEPFVKDNSNTLLAKVRDNSNALLGLCQGIENNSNAVIAIQDLVNPQNILNNSNAIVQIRKDLSTVDAVFGDRLVAMGNESLLFSLFLHSQNKLIIDENLSTSPFTTLNGNGHFVRFALNQNDILAIGDNVTLILENIVLKDFQSSAVKLGSNSALVFGNGTVVELAHSEQLAMNWNFQGSAQLNGFGHELQLGSWALESSQSSELLIRDIVLTDVRDNNIRNIGDKASISFENTEICLSRNFSITAGAFVFKRDVQVTGSHAFALQTSMTSTLCGKAIVLFDTGTTLCYDPPIDRRNLLFFEDETAILALNGASLKSSTTGLQLTRGILCVDKVSELFNDGALSLSEAVQFGDGTALGELKLWFKPSASLDVKTGILDYQNLS